MTKPMITIHNAETGEIVEREMNAKEIAQHEADQIAHADRLAQEAAKEAAKAALLAKLGITDDEAKLLLS
jgi:hypothetical protein